MIKNSRIKKMTRNNKCNIMKKYYSISKKNYNKSFPRQTFLAALATFQIFGQPTPPRGPGPKNYSLTPKKSGGGD